MTRPFASERGSATAFLAVFMVAFLALGGLVIDGGFALAAQRRAINEAQAAARAGAGALAIREFRSGDGFQVDAAAATEAANAYLARTGHAGDVRVEAGVVEVRVSFRQPVAVLKVLGVDDLEVRGVGRARQARGVIEEES
ncbi:MAG: pilus assembly protein TadG-related protein [Acidimicrobiales bacterium]